MREMYVVKIGKQVDILDGGLISIGKKPSGFEHNLTLQIYADSISEVYRKVVEEHNKYNIISIDKL